MTTIDEDEAEARQMTKDSKSTQLPEWFLMREALEIDKWRPMGSGGFGCVYCAEWLHSTVAVKVLGGRLDETGSSRLTSDASRQQSALSTTSNARTLSRKATSLVAETAQGRQAFKREADIWFRLNHPHVVKLFGACHDCAPPVFVCEHASNGSLDKYLRAHPAHLWSKLHEAALGVQYLHQRGIVHADLKCNNIVVGSDLKAKVTDFGLSLVLHQLGDGEAHIFGALQWVAPECLTKDHAPPSLASDIYSLGMCIVEALRIVQSLSDDAKDSPASHVGHCTPWGNLDDSTVQYHVQHGVLPLQPKCTVEQWELVKKMCQRNPAERIKISAVVYALEQFADPSAASSDYTYLPVDQLDVATETSSFWDGNFVDDWRDLERLAAERPGNSLQDQMFQDVGAIFTRLQRPGLPWSLLTRFRTLLADFSRVVLSSAFNRFRIVDMTSREATAVSLNALGRHIDDLHHILDVFVDDDGNQDAQCRSYLARQVDLFVSENPPVWLLLSDAASDEAQQDLLAFLSAEVSSLPPNYSPGHLGVVREVVGVLAVQRCQDIALLRPKWFIPWYELVVRGRGVYGDRSTDGYIYRAKWLGSEVILRLPSSSATSSSTSSNQDDDPVSWRAAFQQQVERWFSLNHPHVLRLYGACHVGDRPFLVCEYAFDGSFHRLLRQHPGQLWRAMYEAALGVEYLVDRGFVHGALTCGNMVVTSDGKAKVTYHGWADDGAASALNDATKASDACQWIAPECLVEDAQIHTFASDVYSLGMCIVEAMRTAAALLEGEDDEVAAFPWGALVPPGAVKYFVKRGRLPPRPRTATDDGWSLVSRMCTYDPSGRPSIRQVVRDLKQLAESNAS